MQNSTLYPPNPANVPESATRPSPEFRRQVTRVLATLLLFFIVYLLLILAAFALAAFCVYGGVMVIMALTSTIGILIGAGVIVTGLMVFFFMVKFIFAVSRVDKSGIIEISEPEQPRLFAFTRQLASDIGTPFPKRIYLSADVNACVFYDSSFWSMFLPVKKNLQIGLGLVNAINLSELKAVIAHEFGHFSQRSMKLGSFVYNVNKVIHNMLFENSGYSSTLNAFANASGVFTFFAHITAGIVNGIQSILKDMYEMVNKGYMSLSREMEFHADAVAASVSGSQSLITALRKIDLADTSYQEVIRLCNEWVPEGKRVSNLFDNQQAVLQVIAQKNKLKLQDSQAIISDRFFTERIPNRINFKDQWASHPLQTDREDQLQKLAIQAEEFNQPAHTLFDGWDQVKATLTDKVYEGVQFKENPIIIQPSDFAQKYESESTKFSLPEEYNGFFNNRLISHLEEADLMPIQKGTSFEQVFSPQRVSLFQQIQVTKRDLATLQAIQSKTITTKTFDFDGKKFNASQAGEVVKTLEEDISRLEGELKEADREMAGFFLLLAGQKSKEEEVELRSLYQSYFTWRKNIEGSGKTIDDMMKPLVSIYQGNTLGINMIESLIGQLKLTTEPAFKEMIRQYKDDGLFDAAPDIRGKISEFLNKDYRYFFNDRFFDNELIELSNTVDNFWSAAHQFLFEKFKNILHKQLHYLNQ